MRNLWQHSAIQELISRLRVQSVHTIGGSNDKRISRKARRFFLLLLKPFTKEFQASACDSGATLRHARATFKHRCAIYAQKRQMNQQSNIARSATILLFDTVRTLLSRICAQSMHKTALHTSYFQASVCTGAQNRGINQQTNIARGT